MPYQERQYFLGENQPTAIKTIFGYDLIGSASTTNKKKKCISHHNTLLTVTNHELHTAIQKFWVSEDLPFQKKLSPEEQECENHFVNTHTRLDDGKYQVRLPFKREPTALGDSSKSALRTFQSIEQKLVKDPQLKTKYLDFMEDYQESGHMVPCTSLIPSDKPYYFLPHHSVFKDGKIRVVFNGSSATSTGTSLNTILHQGPKLHNDIPDIILDFRLHKFVFVCDIQ